MSAKTVIKSIIQKGDKSLSSMYKAFDNANETAKESKKEPKQDKKK